VAVICGNLNPLKGMARKAHALWANTVVRCWHDLSCSARPVLLARDDIQG
jgi:hypothetical protein